MATDSISSLIFKVGSGERLVSEKTDHKLSNTSNKTTSLLPWTKSAEKYQNINKNEVKSAAKSLITVKK